MQQMLPHSFFIIFSVVQVAAVSFSVKPTVTAGVPAIVSWFRHGNDPVRFGVMERNLKIDAIKLLTTISDDKKDGSGTINVTFDDVGQAVLSGITQLKLSSGETPHQLDAGTRITVVEGTVHSLILTLPQGSDPPNASTAIEGTVHSPTLTLHQGSNPPNASTVVEGTVPRPILTLPPGSDPPNASTHRSAAAFHAIIGATVAFVVLLVAILYVLRQRRRRFERRISPYQYPFATPFSGFGSGARGSGSSFSAGKRSSINSKISGGAGVSDIESNDDRTIAGDGEPFPIPNSPSVMGTHGSNISAYRKEVEAAIEWVQNRQLVQSVDGPLPRCGEETG